jgi:hypothetical protein
MVWYVNTSFYTAAMLIPSILRRSKFYTSYTFYQDVLPYANSYPTS